MPNPFLYIWTVLFQAIQFSISTEFNSIWNIDRTLSNAIITMELETIALKRYTAFSQSSSTTGPPHQIVECHIQDFYWGSLTPFAEMQSVYSVAQAYWAKKLLLGLVSLLNGIYTFVNNLMPKLCIYMNSSGIIYSIPDGIRVFIHFPRILVWKRT